MTPNEFPDPVPAEELLANWIHWMRKRGHTYDESLKHTPEYEWIEIVQSYLSMESLREHFDTVDRRLRVRLEQQGKPLGERYRFRVYVRKVDEFTRSLVLRVAPLS